MKNSFDILKNGLISIAGILVVLFSVSCLSTCKDVRQEREKLNRISNLISLGDDIHKTRATLIVEGFRVSEVGFATIDKDELTFQIKLTDYDSLDGFEYSTETRLRPWRDKLVYAFSVRSDLSGMIISFSENIDGNY
jgi:hypothetical protein